MRSILLIFNPLAARTNRSVLNSVRSIFSSSGCQVSVGDVSTDGDAEELVRDGVDRGVDLVAVYGGDGTITRAVGAMIGTDAVLGVIPGGTGNLLAGNLRLPHHPTRAARAILSGSPRAIDIGRMRCGGVDRYFTVACGAGVDAEITAGTTLAAKRRFGRVAYIAKTFEVLGRLEGADYRVTIDGHARELQATSVVVANCGEIIPPLLSLHRDISVSDGLLDVIMLTPTGYRESLDAFWQIVRGKADGRDRVQFAKGRSVTVETDEPRPVELDGEGSGTTPFVADVIPSGVEICVPRNARRRTRHRKNALRRDSLEGEGNAIRP